MIAISFLTAFPLGKGKVVEPRDMARSMAFFPLVGLWLGAMMWGIDVVLAPYMPVMAVSALLIGFIATVTGGLHLDGFSDTIDGLFSGRMDREKILAIMKDSHVGAMGVIGLVVLLMVKFAFLTSITSPIRWQALLLAPALARWSQVLVAFGSEYARKEGSLARPFVEFLEFSHFVIATIFAAGAVYFFSGRIAGFIAFGAVGVFTFLAKLYFARKLGGITGDTIGAVSEINEVVVLAAFLVFAGM